MERLIFLSLSLLLRGTSGRAGGIREAYFLLCDGHRLAFEPLSLFSSISLYLALAMPNTWVAGIYTPILCVCVCGEANLEIHSLFYLISLVAMVEIGGQFDEI